MCFLLPQGSGELSDKALFKERMSLLAQGAATPINCLFEVSCRPAQAAALTLIRRSKPNQRFPLYFFSAEFIPDILMAGGSVCPSVFFST